MIPIVLWLPLPILAGIVLFLLIVFQVLNGTKIIKVPFAVHRGTAFAGALQTQAQLIG
jgi:hypothetical protein